MRTKIIVELVSSLTSVKDLNNIKMCVVSVVEKTLGMKEGKEFQVYVKHEAI